MPTPNPFSTIKPPVAGGGWTNPVASWADFVAPTAYFNNLPLQQFVDQASGFGSLGTALPDETFATGTGQLPQRVPGASMGQVVPWRPAQPPTSNALVPQPPTMYARPTSATALGSGAMAGEGAVTSRGMGGGAAGNAGRGALGVADDAARVGAGTWDDFLPAPWRSPTAGFDPIINPASTGARLPTAADFLARGSAAGSNFDAILNPTRMGIDVPLTPPNLPSDLPGAWAKVANANGTPISRSLLDDLMAQARAGIPGADGPGMWPGGPRGGVNGGVGGVAGDATSAGAGVAGGVADDVARSYLSRYLSSAGTMLNPLNYRGGNVPFVNPTGGALSSWSNLASRIPGSGRLAGLARYGTATGFLPGVVSQIGGRVLQGGSDDQTAWDNIVEAAGAGGMGGSTFGPVGALIGAGGVGFGQAVTEGVRATGLLGDGRAGSFVDILSNNDNGPVSFVGSMFGGDQGGTPTALKLGIDLNPDGSVVTNYDRMNTAFDSLGLNPTTRQALTSQYDQTVALYKAQYEANPQQFAAAFEAAQGVPFDPAMIEQIAYQDIVDNQLPAALASQQQSDDMLARAAEFQALLSPYYTQMADSYASLAATPGLDPNIAALISQQGLASERSARSLPAFQAMSEYQSQYNQLAQQQFQAAIAAQQQGATSPTDQTAAALMAG